MFRFKQFNVYQSCAFAFALLMVFFASCSDRYFLIKNKTNHITREDLDTGALKTFVRNNFHNAPDPNIFYETHIIVGRKRYGFVGQTLQGSYTLTIKDTRSEFRFEVNQHNDKFENIVLQKKCGKWRGYYQFSSSGLLQSLYNGKELNGAHNFIVSKGVSNIPTITKKIVFFDQMGAVKRLWDYDKLFKFKSSQLDRFYRVNLKERIQSASPLWYPSENLKEIYLEKIYQEGFSYFPYSRNYPYYFVSSFTLDSKQITRVVDGNDGKILRVDTVKMNEIM
ncbi:MAG: hypothetical protein V4560_15260 [Bacteroidota bacterium]